MEDDEFDENIDDEDVDDRVEICEILTVTVDPEVTVALEPVISNGNEYW